MATSVSSERAFSQGGITISKRRNRLKADVVEALQCLKCTLRQGLFFKDDDSPSSVVERELAQDPCEDGLEEQEAVAVVDDDDEESWDLILDEDGDIYDD